MATTASIKAVRTATRCRRRYDRAFRQALADAVAAGCSLQEIADAIGYAGGPSDDRPTLSRQHVHKIVNATRKEG